MDYNVFRVVGCGPCLIFQSSNFQLFFVIFQFTDKMNTCTSLRLTSSLRMYKLPRWRSNTVCQDVEKLRGNFAHNNNWRSYRYYVTTSLPLRLRRTQELSLQNIRQVQGLHTEQNKEISETTILMQEGLNIQEVPCAVLQSDPGVKDPETGKSLLLIVSIVRSHVRSYKVQCYKNHLL